MIALFRLAFRNAFRNGRRSALTAATVMIGTAFCVVTLSFMGGLFDTMIGAWVDSNGPVRVVTAEYAEREALQPLHFNIPESDPVLEKVRAVGGVAMAEPDQRCVLLDGDGSLLMNLSSLATEGWRSPKNLVHICWDNRMYEMTGKQATATAGPTDLAAVAAGSGFPKVERVETLEAFEGVLERALKEDGPWFILALVTGDRAKRDPRSPKSATGIRHRFTGQY